MEQPQEHNKRVMYYLLPARVKVLGSDLEFHAQVSLIDRDNEHLIKERFNKLVSQLNLTRMEKIREVIRNRQFVKAFSIANLYFRENVLKDPTLSSEELVYAILQREREQDNVIAERLNQLLDGCNSHAENNRI